MKDQYGGVIFNTNVNNTITFTGRRYDAESGLYYYRNRMYSPELGRFISKDPKGYVDGMNLYAYVKNNPLKYLDAFGTTANECKGYCSTNDEYVLKEMLGQNSEEAKRIENILAKIQKEIEDNFFIQLAKGAWDGYSAGKLIGPIGAIVGPGFGIIDAAKRHSERNK